MKKILLKKLKTDKPVSEAERQRLTANYEEEGYSEEGTDDGSGDDGSTDEGDTDDGGDEGATDDGGGDDGSDDDEEDEGPFSAGLPEEGSDWQEEGVYAYGAGWFPLGENTGVGPECSEDTDCTGDGITGGPFYYIEEGGNVYLVEPGDNTLPDGTTVTVNPDGTIQQITLPTMNATGTIVPATGDIALEVSPSGSSTVSTTFNGLSLASSANAIVNGRDSADTLATISAQGLLPALESVAVWYLNGQVTFEDSISIFFGLTSYLNLYYSLPQFNKFVTQLGYTLSDVVDLFNS